MSFAAFSSGALVSMFVASLAFAGIVVLGFRLNVVAAEGLAKRANGSLVVACGAASLALTIALAYEIRGGWSFALASVAGALVAATYVALLRAASRRTPADAVAAVSREILELQASERRYRVHARRLQALHAIASPPSETARDPVGDAMRLALEECDLVSAFCGYVDEDGTNFTIERTVGDEASLPQVGACFALASTFVGFAFESDDACVIADVKRIRRFDRPVAFVAGGGFVGLQIRAAGPHRRAIGFWSRGPLPDAFARESLDFLRAVGDVVGAAIAREIGRSGLSRLAYYDALTGLPNRVLLRERISRAVAAGTAAHLHFAVLYLDLDGFKEINDRYGHATGDDVLRTFGGRLVGAMRESDTTARLGGDEFVVLARGVGSERDAARVAARIFDALRDPLRVRGRDHLLSASIGISLFPRDGESPEALLDSADRALYAAKAAGKNAMRFALERAAMSSRRIQRAKRVS